MLKKFGTEIKKKSIADQKAFDSETSAMLFEGASLSQLSQLFSQDIRKVKAKLHGLSPVKTRAGHPIYNVAEAARHLVQPMWGIDEYIKRMNHADLPTLLSKEYWAGMRTRQIFEEAAGDLWRTDEVTEHITEILKTISVSLRLSADSVERETSLSVQQRNTIIRLMDETLANAHKTLQKAMLKARKGRGGSSATNAVEDTEL